MLCVLNRVCGSDYVGVTRPPCEGFSISRCSFCVIHLFHQILDYLDDALGCNSSLSLIVQTSFYHILKLIPHSDSKDNLWSCLKNFLKFFLIFGLPWWPTLQNFVENNSQRPNITFFAVNIVIKSFRTHIERTSYGILLLFPIFLFLGKTKISYFNSPIVY